jgi:Tol biopolymer transport system component
MKSILIAMLVFSGINIFAQEGKKEDSKYLAQEQPGLMPKVFAPGIVSVENRFEYGNTFSPDGKEFFYAVNVGQKPEIHVVKFENNAWTKPVILINHEQYGYNDPFLTPDGKRLFFISDRASDGNGPKKDIDIWFIERTRSGWTEPVNAGKEINSNKNEYYISFTKNGKMYFSSNGETSAENDKNYDIKTSAYKNGQFQRSEVLGAAINSANYEADVFIAPDESYIIYCSERPAGKGTGDLYISFKDNGGAWQPAKIMDAGISTDAYEFCPYVTNDGKYFFFSRSGDIYWVSAEIINKFR